MDLANKNNIYEVIQINFIISIFFVVSEVVILTLFQVKDK
jgi:hypothetical protein